MATENKKLTIGKLASAARVNIETIRYYLERGLIDEPPKPAKGFRLYPEDIVDRVFFIKRAQKLGFTLREIKQLLELGDGQGTNIKKMAQDKLLDIEKKIEDLSHIRLTLVDLISKCDNNQLDRDFTVIDALIKS